MEFQHYESKWGTYVKCDAPDPSIYDEWSGTLAENASATIEIHEDGILFK